MNDQLPATTIEAPAATVAPRLTLAARVEDLETQIAAQNRHIADLHQMVDQCVEQLSRLGVEVGLDAWRPDLRLAAIPDAIVTNDRSLRARRADRFVKREDERREAAASEESLS